jgi:hypothetical protein
MLAYGALSGLSSALSGLELVVIGPRNSDHKLTVRGDGTNVKVRGLLLNRPQLAQHHPPSFPELTRSG